jgi:hypothetical protein
VLASWLLVLSIQQAPKKSNISLGGVDFIILSAPPIQVALLWQ